jgi:hypothetical protein
VKRCDVGFADNQRAWHNLDEVATGFPGRNDLTGREGSRKYDNSLTR